MITQATTLLLPYVGYNSWDDGMGIQPYWGSQLQNMMVVVVIWDVLQEMCVPLHLQTLGQDWCVPGHQFHISTLNGFLKCQTMKSVKWQFVKLFSLPHQNGTIPKAFLFPIFKDWKWQGWWWQSTSVMAAKAELSWTSEDIRLFCSMHWPSHKPLEYQYSGAPTIVECVQYYAGRAPRGLGSIGSEDQYRY